MRFLNLVLILSVGITAKSQEQPCGGPDHGPWTKLLQTHVDNQGWVSYNGFVKDSTKLNVYLESLSDCAPTNKLSKEEKLAYWINVYNAFTVKLIVDHYPVESIKDIKRGIPFINSVWEMDFFQIDGNDFDLSKVEHDILRKEFDEPRIHFAIVCASKSCPRLLNEAFDPDKIEQQLELQAKNFINDSSKNELGSDQVSISSIFKWFKGDFTGSGSLMVFIQKYSDSEVSATARIKYLEYDWSLNGE